MIGTDCADGGTQSCREFLVVFDPGDCRVGQFDPRGDWGGAVFCRQARVDEGEKGFLVIRRRIRE